MRGVADLNTEAVSEWSALCWLWNTLSVEKLAKASTAAKKAARHRPFPEKTSVIK